MRRADSHQGFAQRRMLVLAAAVAAAAPIKVARAAELFRDDFNGTALGTWWSLGNWQIGNRTWFGNNATVQNGIATLTLNTYNAQHPGFFKGTEIWTANKYDRGTNGLEMEARVRVNPLPDGLVTSFFTYAARTQFNPPLADEIDFEHLSKALNAAPAGQKPILLTTWNDYKTDGTNFTDPNVHNSASVVAPGWDPYQYNTYRIRWLGNRVEWYLNGQLLRTATQAVPNDPQNVRINFWAPGTEWMDAYAPSLTPASSSSQNTTYYYNVDWVGIRDAYNPISATAPNRTFTDHFKNGNVGNSDSITNFWTQRNLGAGTVTEPSGNPLTMTASGAGFPHAQVVSTVRPEFNFFTSPIRITADGIDFNSTSNSYSKSILRFVLSSQSLASNSDSEYTAEDAFSLRIQGDNQITLGYKLNQTNVNSEFNTNLLNTSVSGPVRHFSLVLSPDFYTLSVEHELSATDGTRVTDTFTGSLSISMSDWRLLSAGSATGNSAMFVQTQLNNSLASEKTTARVDSLAVDDVKSSWQNDSDGNWSSASSWSSPDGVPNFRGANAIFGNVITAPRTVRLDAPATAGVLRFDSPQGYTLGGATLTLSTPAAGATVDVISGAHTIAAPVQLVSDATVTVAGGSTLTLSGGVRGAANLTTAGAGTTTASALDVQSLNVSAGTTKLLYSGSPVRSRVTSLSVASGATLDVGGNALVIDYSGSSPAATVRSLLTTGQGGGTWNGTGLTSSAANGTTFGVGYAEAPALGTVPAIFGSVDDTSLLVRWTRLGDANLDGAVDLTDFTFLASNFNGTGKAWLDGDFNYDGAVNLTDFTMLAGNFNTTAGAIDLGVSVPEPMSMLVFTCAVLTCRARRRK